MMRYSSEEEREWKEGWEEFLKKKKEQDNASCMKCFFFTHNPEHDHHRCHCGSCPALKKW